jgi:hypothetical protein
MEVIPMTRRGLLQSFAIVPFAGTVARACGGASAPETVRIPLPPHATVRDITAFVPASVLPDGRAVPAQALGLDVTTFRLSDRAVEAMRRELPKGTRAVAVRGNLDFRLVDPNTYQP